VAAMAIKNKKSIYALRVTNDDSGVESRCNDRPGGGLR
jgi:hypothetical protein